MNIFFFFVRACISGTNGIRLQSGRRWISQLAICSRWIGPLTNTFRRNRSCEFVPVKRAISIILNSFFRVTQKINHKRIKENNSSWTRIQVQAYFFTSHNILWGHHLSTGFALNENNNTTFIAFASFIIYRHKKPSRVQ